MKNKHFTIVALAAAVLATSCASEDIAEPQKQNQGEPKTVTLTASVNDDTNATTRVGMTKDDTNAKFYWHKDDAISVLTVNGSSYSNAKFTTTAENGATTATFTGDVTGKVGGYAVYPYSDSHTFTSETALQYNLPATYSYETVESNIFSKTDGSTTYPANSTNIPLVGKIADGKIDFKHIGGLAVIRIDKMPSASGTLTVTADQQLSGYINVDLSADTPTLAASESASEADQKVEFNFEGAEQDKAGVFYLPLATGSYSNVKIEVISGLTNSTVEYGNLEVTRASVTAIPLYNNDGEIGKEAKKGDGKYTIDGHTFIDLGLPSGLLWAETNIGAEKASDYGNYYAWGETTTKDNYSKASYTYTENPKTLDADHDAATANWGSSCRMPTNAEFDELSANCTWEWTTVDGVDGYKVSSKKEASISIFLPAAGYRYDEKISVLGRFGYYWSSSLHSSSDLHAYRLYFLENNRNSSSSNKRHEGHTVRPVAVK